MAEGVGESVGEGLGLGVGVSSVGMEAAAGETVWPDTISAGVFAVFPDGEAGSEPVQAASIRRKRNAKGLGSFFIESGSINPERMVDGLLRGN